MNSSNSELVGKNSLKKEATSSYTRKTGQVVEFFHRMSDHNCTNISSQISRHAATTDT
jgi:hypothetical protein